MKQIFLLIFTLIFIAILTPLSVVKAANITLLTGSSYKDYVTEKTYSKEIITIDHFGPWKYGNLFFFYDISKPAGKNDRSDFFGSISPSLSFNKISGQPASEGFLSDILLKLELEHVSGLTPIYYYGLTYQLNIPRLRYFNLDTVVRDDPTKSGVGGQINFSWSLPVLLKNKHQLFFQGFVSTGVIPESEDAFFLMTQPQLNYDLHPFLDIEPETAFIGIEYSLGINRFLKKNTINSLTGNREAGFNEEVWQLLAKLAF